MKSDQILCLILLLVFSLNSFSQTETKVEERVREGGWWLEIWSDLSYRKTNFAKDTPSSEQEDDFFIANVSAKLGWSFLLGKSKNFFWEPYLKLEPAIDFGSHDWNDAYWNNHMTWGPGLRLRYERKKNILWFDNIIFDVFSEYLWRERSVDSSKNDKRPKPDTVSSENGRVGISSWISSAEKHFIWTEMWSELTYEHTHFSDNSDKEDFFILILQPKVGVKWKMRENLYFQPYYKLDVIRDFRDNTWNEDPLLNSVKYGPGIRLSLSNFWEGANVRVYAEYLEQHYFSRVSDNKYKKLASDDLIAGIELWLPFGATRKSIIRH